MTEAVDRLLGAIERGAIGGCGAYAPDARLSATVPNWRLHRQGCEAIEREYTKWFADPGRFAVLRRIPFAGGEVVEYVLTWEENGVPHTAHHVHILEVEGDRIVADTVMCGGRWPAPLVAEMEAASRA
jgi:hypothetical protein